MKTIYTLAMYWKNFGVLSGTINLLKFKFKRTQNIKLNNIKHPIFLRKNTSDIPTFFQIFTNNHKLSIQKHPENIIDCGANIGLFTIYMKNKYPDATCICVEPDKENFEVLKKNTKKYNNVFCENKGVWNKTTQLKVFDKYNKGKFAMVVEEDVENGDISAISISDIMKEYKMVQIDILKIDVETSEKIIFSENYSEWLLKTKMIIIELHDWMEEGCSKIFFNAIQNTIKDYQFAIYGECIVITNLKLT